MLQTVVSEFFRMWVLVAFRAYKYFPNVQEYAGLQISLNYIMNFNAKLTPNSSRDYLGGDGGLLGATRLSP